MGKISFVSYKAFLNRSLLSVEGNIMQKIKLMEYRMKIQL